MSIRKLAGETAIYGLSSILGRLLYFFLMPLYVRIFDLADYGVVTDLFAFTGILFIFYTYRMETAYFRYGTDGGDSGHRAYDTALISVIVSSLVFSGLIFVFSGDIATLFRYPEYSSLIGMCAGILLFDALAELPLSRLRLEGKALKFATVRLTGIGINIGFNLFFLVLCPYLLDQGGHDWIRSVYDPSVGIGYIFLSNLLASAAIALMLLPLWLKSRYRFDWKTGRSMLVYALPLVIVGFSFVINEMFDRKMMIWLLPGSDEENKAALGAYGGCYKLTMILALFTQAFRYGAEPFFFRKKKDGNARQVYADVAKYYAIAGIVGSLFTLLFLDVFKYILEESYWVALGVVPILLLANLLNGLYYNVSIWYRLTDRTITGALIAGGGALLTVCLNIWWLPVWGFVGAAWATLICYGVMLAWCYYLGRRHYPVPYDLSRVGFYFVMAAGLYAIALFLKQATDLPAIPALALNLVLMLAFVYVLIRREPELAAALKKLRSFRRTA